VAKALPGPSMWATTRALLPTPYRALPTFLAATAAQYGPVSTFALPWRRFVFVNDPEAIKAVFVTQQHAFVKSEGVRTLRILLGEGLLTSEDPLHRKMRRIVQPAFHHARIGAYGVTMLEHAREFVAGLHDGETFDMHTAMSELTLKIAGSTLFGADTADQAQAVRDALHETMDVFPGAIGPIGKLRRRLPLASTRRFERARATLDAIVYGLIAERRRSASERGDALSLLLAAGEAEGADRPSDEQIRDEVMTLFLAGHETTANALTWTWYLLALHPEVVERLRAESAGMDFSADPFALLAALEYTTRVVKEAMRLYPPAWIIGRQALADVELLGRYPIPGGATVLISPLVLQRTPSLYPRALEFDPDRWNDGEGIPFAYVPFGGGARRCIGEAFAWMEATLLLAYIARSFTFARTPGPDIRIDPLVTLRPKGPMLVQATKQTA